MIIRDGTVSKYDTSVMLPLISDHGFGLTKLIALLETTMLGQTPCRCVNGWGWSYLSFLRMKRSVAAGAGEIRLVTRTFIPLDIGWRRYV